MIKNVTFYKEKCHNICSAICCNYSSYDYYSSCLDTEVKHVIKCLVDLIAYLLDFIFLSKKIFLNLVNPNIQPLNMHVSLLSSILTSLQLIDQFHNIFLRFFLSLDCFLFLNFQYLQVVSNNFKFLFNVTYFLISSIC